MVRFRESILFSCVLLLLFLWSLAFGQSQRATPIRGQLSVDSAGVKTTQFSGLQEPTRIGVTGPEPVTQPFGAGYAPGYTVPDDSPKCYWVRYHFSGTQWQWLIRKPGCYAAKSMNACIETNGKVRVAFGGFGNLRACDNSGDQLDMRYGVSSPTCQVGGVNWMSCNQMNNYCINLWGYSYATCSWAMWQKVCVERCDNSAEYEDKGYIVIDLLNVYPWVESISNNQYSADK
jgi:hypothetical protein